MDLLDSIIEEDEANSSARKRKVAIFKVSQPAIVIIIIVVSIVIIIITAVSTPTTQAQGDRARTVAELNKYLKVFMSDQVRRSLAVAM